MKYMVMWKIPPGSYRPAVEKFLKTKAPVPDGLESIGRWHVPGSHYGWHLVQGRADALAELGAQWADVLELQVTPVIEDEEAATSLAKVHGG